MNRSGITTLLLLTFLLLGSTPTEAQTNEEKPRVITVADTAKSIEQIRPDEPVDLTLEMYLRRTEADSTLFTPRAAVPVTTLNAGELDSLNPHGKEGEITIPLRGYPAPDDPPRPNRPVYLEGGIGLNTTARLLGGFSGTTWPFHYNASVDFLSTNGHGELNEGNRLSAKLGGGYVIGLGFGMFSGGTMGGEVGYDRKSWRLHAIPTSPMRETSGWNLSAMTTAAVAGIDLRGEAGFTTFDLQQSLPLAEGTSSASDLVQVDMTSLEGRVEARSGVGPISLGGGVELRLTNSSVGTLNYGAVDLNAGFELGPVEVRAGGLFSTAEGNDGESKSLLLPTADVRLSPFDGVVLTGKVGGGVHQSRPDRMIALNPYSTVNGPFLPETERLGYEVMLGLEPSRSWGIKVGASRREFDDYLHFDQVVNGEFLPVMDEVVIDRLEGDLFLLLGSQDRIAALLRFSEGERSDGSAVPYTPRWDAELFYHRQLSDVPVRAGGSIRYIGERTSGSGTLDPVLLVGFDWSYRFGELFDLVLTARNLLGAEYQIWEGYEERGLYLEIGARARL